jgi:hypothetical protein
LRGGVHFLHVGLDGIKRHHTDCVKEGNEDRTDEKLAFGERVCITQIIFPPQGLF